MECEAAAEVRIHLERHRNRCSDVKCMADLLAVAVEAAGGDLPQMLLSCRVDQVTGRRRGVPSVRIIDALELDLDSLLQVVRRIVVDFKDRLDLVRSVDVLGQGEFLVCILFDIRRRIVVVSAVHAL